MKGPMFEWPSWRPFFNHGSQPERLKSSLNHPKLINVKNNGSICNTWFQFWFVSKLNSEFKRAWKRIWVCFGNGWLKFPTYLCGIDVAALLYDCFLSMIASKAWEQHTQWLIPKSPGCKICFNPLASPNSNHFGRSKRLLYEMALNSVDDRRLVDDGWWRLMTVDDGWWWSLMMVDDVGVIFGWQLHRRIRGWWMLWWASRGDV